MATSETLIPIPGRLHSVASEGHVAGADEIYDDDLGKAQSTINSEKADKSATVSNVSYDSATGKLKKTINGTTTEVCDVVVSGFSIVQDDANGIDEFSSIGSATITEDNTNGIDEYNF